ncbi:MAG: tRNA (adenosine(37)-N6)-threonylcarbamoyltransferase complex dimerization subunit type 1 TsaB [Flavobacteriaceae bacterium]
MAYILQIETATTNCSVALSKNGETIAVTEVNNGYSHAENLHVFIKNILEDHNVDFADLNAIAVSKGPGSYTGLRIGVSAAKGLCFALEIPLIAIETLRVLMQQVNIEQGYIVPMIDARRLEAYTKVYTADRISCRDIQAEILDETSFSEYLEKDTVVFVGNKTEKTQELITHKNAQFVDSLPSASDMSAIAYAKYKKNDIEDVAYFEPYYLKDFLVTPAKKKV